LLCGVWEGQYRGTDTECCCVCCVGSGEGNIEELILNVAVFVVWGLVLQYGEELFLNFTVFFVVSGGGNIERN